MISHESADRISLIFTAAKEQGSLVTLRELLTLLPEDATEEELAHAISATPELSNKFQLKSGYITERSDWAQTTKAVKNEMENRQSALANLQWAARFAPRLESTLFSMVAVSGSTSYRSASKSRDLDLFCIAPSGRLWTTLTKGLVLARLFKILSPNSPDICFSCVMDETFATGLFREEQGPLFARDALEAVVLKGESTYRRYLEEARWISEIYPKAYSTKLQGWIGAPRSGSKPSTASKAVEWFLFLTVGSYIRAKSWLFNFKFVRRGQLESVFRVRYGPDHLIYESRRYSNLKRKYSEALRSAVPSGRLGDS